MPAATGVNIAPTPISARPSSSTPKVVAPAHSRLPSPKTAMPAHSARLRGQLPVATRASGASTAVDMA